MTNEAEAPTPHPAPVARTAEQVAADSRAYYGRWKEETFPAPVARPAGECEAYREAVSLATILWQKHWRETAPHWQPLDNTAGVISQIDNMVSELVHPPSSSLSRVPASPSGSGEALAWAVARWQAEVANRPLRNVHRRTFDDTWRQVIRRFGGDPDVLIGPSHDELANTSSQT